VRIFKIIKLFFANFVIFFRFTVDFFSKIIYNVFNVFIFVRIYLPHVGKILYQR